ncbi:YeaO [Elusimicrobium simillimum]|uniref:DUF488 domain-containing protein n=1 Tax=Elusimicrobium simillimum TaxID=3143438 RepID=UPI003C6FE34E
MLGIKRAYAAPDKADGYRILVDRLWPRGMSKEKEHLNLWDKDIAPTTALRKEFGHMAEKFAWFKKEYIKELNANPHTPEFTREVKTRLAKGNVTFIYGAKDPGINHAIVLKEYISKKIK